MTGPRAPAHSEAYPRSSGDASGVREANLVAILSIIQHHGSVSRAQLSRLVGLNKATVSSLVQELESNDLIAPRGMVAPSRGRPAVLYSLNGQAGTAIGIHIDSHQVHVALTDFSGRIETRWRLPLGHSEDHTKLSRPLQNLMRQALLHVKNARKRVLGIGVSVPGVVDLSTNTLLAAPHIGLQDFSVARELHRLSDAPVYVENEAKAAAMGEWLLGAARGANNFLYLSGGWGLGGAVVLDGNVFRGSQGFAGIVGHMVVDPHGPVCSCGAKGCWETLVSLPAMARTLGVMSRQARPVHATEVLEEAILEAVIDHVRAAPDRSQKALDQVGRYLGVGIGNLISAFNPSLIVLGRAFAILAPYLLPSINETLGVGLFARFRRCVAIAPSTLGYDAPLIGAACVVIRQVLARPRESRRAEAAHPLGKERQTLITRLRR